MLDNGVFGTGISAHKGANDLSDLGDILDAVEALDVEAIELPIYDMDIVVGGRIRRPALEALKRACAGRNVAYSAHGPLAINFFDEPFRLARHFEVLEASMEVAAEVGAGHYVMHAGLAPVQQMPGIEAAFQRQRDYLVKAGDIAAGLDLVICVETMFGGHEGRIYTPSPARLAAELGRTGHPSVMATLDFSHAYLRSAYHGADFLAEIEAIAPYARHLHMHDSFGRADDIWMYTVGEKLAYGHGDLHLPVGWGDIPWNALMERCVFPEGVVFNIELQSRYWHAAGECIAATRALAGAARTAARQAA